ncbi:hypothetical protein BUE60_01715 [Pseudomonas syringae pv. actinidiae]|nr:hypothetical protein BUE61_11085 [Pseudomonas syringae pv. actinidiae]PBK57147.1 hypothetical protein BUE60_01715 [Pseudomonas syringae pv. actinidiae]
MRNDNLEHDHYRATLRVGMLFWTLRVLFCDAERHALHFHAGACGTIRLAHVLNRAISVGQSLPPAFQPA